MPDSIRRRWYIDAEGDVVGSHPAAATPPDWFLREMEAFVAVVDADTLVSIQINDAGELEDALVPAWKGMVRVED